MNGNSAHAAQEPLFDTSKTAQLHREVGELLTAASYAIGQLARHEQDQENPHLVRALSVLRKAVDEVAR